MFNKRMVYFMAGEAGKQAPEQDQSGPEAAKAKMAEFMPAPDELGKKDEAKVENVDNTQEQEMNRTDQDARADLLSIAREGKKFTTSVPGVDKATLDQVIAGLKGVPKDGLNTKRVDVDIDGTAYHFVAVGDAAGVKMYYKKGEDFAVNQREFVRDVDNDNTYVGLVTKKGEAIKPRLEKRSKDEQDAKVALEEATKKGKDSPDYKKAKDTYDEASKKLQTFKSMIA